MTKHESSDTWNLIKRITDIVVALATVVAAFSLVVAVLVYKDQERSSRLQRTQTLLAAASGDWNDDQRKALFGFEGRWNPNITPMSPTEADALFKIGDRPSENDQYKKWNAARKHLNVIETLAFAYVYDMADDEILASTMCLYMARSNRYFAALIERAKADYPRHTWQVIPQAVRSMEDRYGTECENLPPPPKAQPISKAGVDGAAPAPDTR
jgi:hypothetical protein